VDKKFCPFLYTICGVHPFCKGSICMWYDERGKCCAVITIAEALARLAAKQ